MLAKCFLIYHLRKPTSLSLGSLWFSPEKWIYAFMMSCDLTIVTPPEEMVENAQALKFFLRKGFQVNQEAAEGENR
jgi:hypothetical protein